VTSLPLKHRQSKLLLQVELQLASSSVLAAGPVFSLLFDCRSDLVLRLCGLLQELFLVLRLSHRIKSLKDLWSKLFYCGSFTIILRVDFCFSSRFLSSISRVVLLAPFHVFIAVPNPVLKADNFAIAVRSWLSWKRGASDRFWDIGQVLQENFDWLPFTPTLFAFSGPSIGIRVGLVTSWL
jgi:hypothetical protein